MGVYYSTCGALVTLGVASAPPNVIIITLSTFITLGVATDLALELVLNNIHLRIYCQDKLGTPVQSLFVLLIWSYYISLEIK
jgi:hypothetical protein